MPQGACRSQSKLLRLALLLGLLGGFATGLWLSGSGVRAQAGLPSTPDIHSITPLHQGLRVYWWPPARDGGSAVTGFDVHYRASGAQTWTDSDHTGLSQPAVITGLGFGTTYEVRVRARNANGAGPWSTVDSRRTPSDDGRPDPPLPPTLTPGDGEIAVSWKAPAYTGTRPIIGYRVRYTSDDGDTWLTWSPSGSSLITGTSAMITGLDNGVLTGVVVAAVSSRGQSIYSAHTAETTPVEALSLTLESSRDICTANTLTKLSWTITGGVPPYTLTIEGEKVDSNAESHRVNCGPLSTDPFSGGLLPIQRRIFKAVVNDSSGEAIRATAAVNLAAPPPYLRASTSLRYGAYDSTGAVAAPGSYAFLSDAGNDPSVVSTYEGLRDGTANALLIHQSDARGASQSTLYARVATGDLFEWHEADACWVRYRVTEVKSDPTGGAPRKLLAVDWVTYGFTDCSGPISANGTPGIAWGSLPDLGGISLAAPLRHGPFQLVPEGWDGQMEETKRFPPPGFSRPSLATDVAAARQLPYWRDPMLPTGWTFDYAGSGNHTTWPLYGYCATWLNDRGYLGVEICGEFRTAHGLPDETPWHGGRGGVIETRVIAGYPALVHYSPRGPNHNRHLGIWVRVYVPETGAVYTVDGYDWSLRGSNVDAVIAIARSLFE